MNSIAAYQTRTFDVTGVTLQLALQGPLDTVLLHPSFSDQVMTGDSAITFVGDPVPLGRLMKVIWTGGIDLNGRTFTINGVSMTAAQMAKPGILEFIYDDGVGWKSQYLGDPRAEQTYAITYDCNTSILAVEILKAVQGIVVLTMHFTDADTALISIPLSIIENPQPGTIEYSAPTGGNIVDGSALVTDTTGNYSNLLTNINCGSGS